MIFLAILILKNITEFTIDGKNKSLPEENCCFKPNSSTVDWQKLTGQGHNIVRCHSQ